MLQDVILVFLNCRRLKYRLHVVTLRLQNLETAVIYNVTSTPVRRAALQSNLAAARDRQRHFNKEFMKM